jgi:hypothetical protein
LDRFGYKNGISKFTWLLGKMELDSLSGWLDVFVKSSSIHFCQNQDIALTLEKVSPKLSLLVNEKICQNKNKRILAPSGHPICGQYESRWLLFSLRNK